MPRTFAVKPAAWRTGIQHAIAALRRGRGRRAYGSFTWP